MKKILAILTFQLILSNFGYVNNNPTVDSLLNVLKNEKIDTSKVISVCP